ncbi:MAG: adenylate/guanylate cyclase domain-containing protein [Anaerolineales bacterium]
MAKRLTADEWWHSILTGNDPALPLRQFRTVFGLIPSNPRCTFCNAPYEGPGAPLMRLMGKRPSTLTPHLCRQCHDEARKHIGGAEVEMTLLFADVRGSTTLAERMSASEFSRLINRFYSAAIDVLVNSGAWSDRLVGDEVIGIYVPGFAGLGHARRAVDAARELLRITGHSQAEGAWLPIGVGVHTGVAFAGAVGRAGGATDITALGDNVNIATRLASKAGPGEILISEATCLAARLESGDLEQRQLELKGKTEPVGVRVARALD